MKPIEEVVVKKKVKVTEKRFLVVKGKSLDVEM